MPTNKVGRPPRNAYEAAVASAPRPKPIPKQPKPKKAVSKMGK